MIKTKADLKYYLLCDKVARGEVKKKPSLLGDELWKWQIRLRKTEYHYNSSGICHKIMYAINYLRLRHTNKRFCSEIPLNVFDEGLVIWHGQNIIVNSRAKVGRNFSISAGCCIGHAKGNCPIIGDNVEMTIGSRILGGITVTNDVTIGAGALVVKDIEVAYTTWGGVPAKCISTNPNLYIQEKKARLTGVLRY